MHQYTGGIEHAILHLLYMRFVCKALRDLGELWFDEPALRLRNQGTIIFGGRKMSKSRGNVQTPDEYVAIYGADTLRLFLMFLGPWTQGSDWDASGIEGVHRFLNRVWMLGLTDPGAGPRDRAIDRALHRTIAKVTADLETYHFNTAIAAMMELSNALQHASGPSRADAVDKLILLLAPFAPHIAEELWHRRGGTGTVHRQTWPAYDATLAAALLERCPDLTILATSREVLGITGEVGWRVPSLSLPPTLDTETQRRSILLSTESSSCPIESSTSSRGDGRDRGDPSRGAVRSRARRPGRQGQPARDLPQHLGERAAGAASADVRRRDPRS